MHTVLARYTNSEASRIARTVTGLGEVEAEARFDGNYKRRTLGIIVKVQRLPKASNRRESEEREEKWRAEM